MPTYEYQCDGCQHNFDEFQSFSDKPLKKCPHCGKLKLRRVFGAGAAILFKGSGFYQTDYRSSSYKADAQAEASQGKTGKTDSKDAAQTGGSTGAASPEGKTSTSSKGKNPKSGT